MHGLKIDDLIPFCPEIAEEDELTQALIIEHIKTSLRREEIKAGVTLKENIDAGVTGKTVAFFVFGKVAADIIDAKNSIIERDSVIDRDSVSSYSQTQGDMTLSYTIKAAQRYGTFKGDDLELLGFSTLKTGHINW